MFQFKINHHILYTRDKLFRAKIIENDECQLCGVRQTLEHLFVECRHVHSTLNPRYRTVHEVQIARDSQSCHALSILKADTFVGRSKTEAFKLITQIIYCKQRFPHTS